MRITNAINHIRNNWEYYAGGTLVALFAAHAYRKQPSPKRQEEDVELMRAMRLSEEQAKYESLSRQFTTLLDKEPKERLSKLETLQKELDDKEPLTLIGEMITQLQQTNATVRHAQKTLSTITGAEEPKQGLDKLVKVKASLDALDPNDLSQSKVGQVENMHQKIQKLQQWFTDMIKQKDPFAKQRDTMINKLKTQGTIGQVDSDNNCLFTSIEKLANKYLKKSYPETGSQLRQEIALKLKTPSHEIKSYIMGELYGAQEDGFVGYPKDVRGKKHNPETWVKTYASCIARDKEMFGSLIEVRLASAKFEVDFHVHYLNKKGIHAIAKIGTFHTKPLELVQSLRHYQPFFRKQS